MSDIKIYSDDLIGELYLCTTEDDLNNFFKKYINIFKDFYTKIQIIKECMSVETEFRSPCNLSEEDEYHDWKIIFLEGTWRL